MSNPTTPFNWQMPTNTDLVTDLPADFEVFGQAVATSMADLLGGTTGQILSKATNADMDFTWIANDQGDITGVTATSPLTGGGTSGAITVGIQAASTSQSGAVQLSDSTSTTSSVLASTPTATKSAYDLAAAAVPKSTVTTAGDVIYATGSGAVTRLGIGTAGQVLTVNGGGTAPSWATPAASGSMTSIASGSLSGALSLTSISGSYKNLILVLRAATVTNDDIGIRLNTDTGSNYAWVQIAANLTNPGKSASDTKIQMTQPYIMTGNTPNEMWMTIYDYANTSVWKSVTSTVSGNAGGSKSAVWTNGMYASTTAITGISSLNSFSGGTYILYGVN